MTTATKKRKPADEGGAVFDRDLDDLPQDALELRHLDVPSEVRRRGTVERALVDAAGANATDPRIRAIVDYEEGRLVRKTSEDADQILSSTPDGAVADSATGDAEVSIARGSGDRIKLPGT